MLAFALLFTAMYLIVGSTIRLVTLKWPDSPVSTALMFAH